MLTTLGASDHDDATLTAARNLEIFLDRMLFETAGPGSHLLNPAYDELLDVDERELRSRLEAFLETARPPEGKAEWAWSRIEDAASDLGWRHVGWRERRGSQPTRPEDGPPAAGGPGHKQGKTT
jgi:hypothetical protein